MPLVFPYPFSSLSEASLFSLLVILTHFALSSYEQALYLPISFSILDLAKLSDTKTLQILVESFESTHLLMIFSISPREVLFACLPSSPSNLSSFIVELTLSFPCSSFDPFLSSKVRLSFTLILSHLTIW